MAALFILAAAVLAVPDPVAQKPAPAPAQHIVEIRLARKTPSPGFSEAAPSRFPQKVFLANRPLFTQRDFAGAKVAQTGSGVALLLSFTPQAAKRLAAFTRKSRGRELALLLDGRILCVTAVGEPITDGEMALVTDMAYSDAKAVAEALRK
jgi:preprotein translocase subunit SecD